MHCSVDVMQAHISFSDDFPMFCPNCPVALQWLDNPWHLCGHCLPPSVHRKHWHPDRAAFQGDLRACSPCSLACSYMLRYTSARDGLNALDAAQGRCWNGFVKAGAIASGPLAHYCVVVYHAALINL